VAAAPAASVVSDAPAASDPGDIGPKRAVVDRVMPAVDGGRFAVKRVVGEPLVVDADCFTDGHDSIRVLLRWRPDAVQQWTEVEMAALGNDRWRAQFAADAPGRYRYEVVAWVDHFVTWRQEFARRDDLADLRQAARVGAALIAETAARASGADRDLLAAWGRELEAQALAGDDPAAGTVPGDADRAGGRASDAAAALRALALDEARAQLARRYPDRRHEVRWPVELPLQVDRERARFSSWYELFPRSTASEPGAHGTLADCAERLDYVAELGFDVVYLPPIHPIGRERRKGRNNTLAAGPEDVGSPWAIGASEGGHKAIHPQLGGFDDFRALVERARALGMEIALDVAFLLVLHRWPGWQEASFLTGAAADVVPWVTASVGLSIALNLAYLVADPRWFRAVGEILTSVVGAVVAGRILDVFPFTFPDGGFPWATWVRVALVLAVLGCVVGVLANVVQLVRVVSAREA